MDIKVSHACPSCGGPVEMQEADRLTSCPYCDVQNYMVGGRMLRFVLPDKIPKHITSDSIFYFPYLRFKGNIYTCTERKVGCKVLDTTHQGIDAKMLPASLGLRPQAMTVKLVHDQISGRFIKRRATPAEVLGRAEKLADSVIDSGSDPMYHRAFIGESVSCLYQPLYVEDDTIYDGVLNRRVGSVDGVGDWLNKDENLTAYNRNWQPGFLAMICPRCGDTMKGESDSLVVHCFNCDSCWAESKGAFRRVEYQVIPGNGRVAHLPFWRLQVESEGLEMKTLGDLLDVANQPVVIRDIHRQKKLEFWIPAVKIRPKVFITLAKTATLSQLKFPDGNAELSRSIQPVTLPRSEAVQAVKSVFAELTVNKKDVMPALPKLSFKVKSAALVFLPFTDTGHDYVQNHSGLSVAASVLKFGRKL